MSVQFNGQTTINGNVEMYDNGSMKIINNQVNVDIKNLQEFIEDNLKYSNNKIEYLEAAEVLKNSTDESKIKEAVNKFKRMSAELGKAILVTGLSEMIMKMFS